VMSFTWEYEDLSFVLSTLKFIEEETLDTDGMSLG
jgi:hypothetical protein